MGGDRASERAAMLATQLVGRGITDQRVLAAMGSIPRERFVPESEGRNAYADRAVSIGAGQTISQPWIVAAICQALELTGTESVLEVGTGSCYSAAVLAQLAARVTSIERIEELALAARARLAALELDDTIEIRIGDGSLGDVPGGPFEAIAVHAAVPQPPTALLDRLATGGRLIAPVARGGDEILTRFRRHRDPPASGPSAFSREPLVSCRFVPLIGEQAYPPAAGDSE
jgi:protein-L-isoaspartate(D-aspartate) O-methyltransferase